MRGALLLAWRSTAASWGRNALLALALGISAGLPLAAGSALNAVEASLHQRAQSTPLVAGPPGSPIDLVLRTTEFTGSDSMIPSMSLGELQSLHDAAAGGYLLPVVLGARASHAYVVGVPLEYLEWRDLRVAEGRTLATLGDCVVGSNVARAWDVMPGASITTHPDQVYNMAGSYPVRLHVVGVLAPAHTADDDVVFVSLETAWLIAGIGHGHQALDGQSPVALLLRKDEGNVTASAAVREYLEVTPENAGSFHFHGDPAAFPVHGAIIVPADARAAAIARGRADAQPTVLQVVRPAEVIDSLFARVFHVRDLLVAVFATVFGAAVLLAATLCALAIRVRAPQIALLERVGASRAFVWRMLAAELALIAAAAALVCAAVACAAPLLEPLIRAQLR